jgi:hypothetical protein
MTVDLTSISGDTRRLVVRRNLVEAEHWLGLTIEALEVPVRLLVHAGPESEVASQITLMERWIGMLLRLRDDMTRALETTR